MIMQRPVPKIALRGFKPGGRGAGHVLGELESAVMETLWSEAGQTVNDVEVRLRDKRDIAHTTGALEIEQLVTASA